MNAFLKRLLVVSCLFLFVTAEALAVHVKGYTRKDGTYVQPHERTAPNKTKNDNYSTRGNVNPYTGKVGTKPRDEDSAPKAQQNEAASATKEETAKEADSPIVGWLAVKSGMVESELKRQMGSPIAVEGKGGYEIWKYPTGIVYVKEQKVIAWKQVKAP